MFKKSSVFTIFLLLLINYVSFSQGFNSVFSKDGMDVLAVGNNGNYFRSADGGNTWSSYFLGTDKLNSVFAVSQNIWASGDNGKLYYSSNNGATWNNQTLAGGQNLNTMFFTDANTGWIAGDNGTILKTTNAGVNWSSQTSPVSSSFKAIKFTSVTSGLACSSGGKIVYTTNGGTNWLQYTISMTNDLLSIDKKANTIIAGVSEGFAIRSTDNGTTWSVIDYNIATKSEINSVFMMDANTFYSCGGGGFIRKSTNAGSTFMFEQNPMLANLVSIYFFDANKGWAVSSLNNAIIRTTDGGSSWLLPANTTVTYSWAQKQSGSGNIGNGFALHPRNKNGIFIAMGSAIYRSLNKGENWTYIASLPSSPAHSFYVSPKDTNMMLASVGSSGGHVYRSTDYGQTWIITWGPGQLTSYGMPMEMDENHPDTVFLGPDNSILLRSTDFGATWTNWSNFSFRSPCDFAIVYGNSNIMYCGDGTTGSGSGEFYKSTDGGINWALIHSVVGSEIPMIAISNLDPQLAIHSTWSAGGIWRTTNQWQNYSEVTTTSNCWADDIAKDDPTVAAYGVYGSTIYVSTDGGLNYTASSVGSSPEAGMLYYDRGNLFVQHGGGVYKMTVNYSVITANKQISGEVPKQFYLNQNYPNPFNPSTTIDYSISKLSFVQIKIYDILGRVVNTLINRDLAPGKYTVNFTGDKLSSGVYFYSLISDGNRIDTKKFILNK
jgi:photosystem II stability/assembly factor-like uncharacterized protein